MEVHILKRNNNSLNTPLILINFKTYSEALGEKAVRLAKIAEMVSKKTGKCIAVAPQYTDIRRIARETNLPVFAQHIDPVEPGAHTGKILPESIKEAGAIGTLINHSERQMKISDIERCILSAKSLGLLKGTFRRFLRRLMICSFVSSVVPAFFGTAKISNLSRS